MTVARVSYCIKYILTLTLIIIFPEGNECESIGIEVTLGGLLDCSDVLICLFPSFERHSMY